MYRFLLLTNVVIIIVIIIIVVFIIVIMMMTVIIIVTNTTNNYYHCPLEGIGRLRSGRAGLVTPVEFRYTLIKLGIVLPPEMCDQVFVVFDEDRSGSINFDEFSTW